jgi:hypothetical protein
MPRTSLPNQEALPDGRIADADAPLVSVPLGVSGSEAEAETAGLAVTLALPLG